MSYKLYFVCSFSANVPLRLSTFENETSISTELPGNSPIWITKTSHGTFLNNARYQSGNFDVQIEGTNQVIHILDQVLEPTVPGTPASESSYLINPDAGKYLDHASVYSISENQLTT